MYLISYKMFIYERFEVKIRRWETEVINKKGNYALYLDYANLFDITTILIRNLYPYLRGCSGGPFN